MKKMIPVLLIAGVVVYGLYINKSGPETQTIVEVVTPPPSAPPVEVVKNAGPIAPDLSLIVLRGGREITNGIVRQITANGIIFQADQGLIQALFEDLPAEFFAYYRSSIPASQQSSVTKVGSQAIRKVPAKQPAEPVIQNQLDDASRLRKLASLKRQIEVQKSIMDRYSRQSAIKSKGVNIVTREEYDVAKSEYDRLNREYELTR